MLDQGPARKPRRVYGAAYRDAFEPRIGEKAVAAYLEYRRTLRVGKMIALPAWLSLFIGIGLHNIPIGIIGGLLVAGNCYYVFWYGGRRRHAARVLAAQHINLPAGAKLPPIDGDVHLFDVWVRLREKGAVKR